MNFPPLVDTTKASVNADLILLLFTIWYLDVQIDPLKKKSRPFSYHNFGLFVGFSWLLWVAIAKPELSLQTIVNLLVFEFKLWPEYISSPYYAVFFLVFSQNENLTLLFCLYSAEQFSILTCRSFLDWIILSLSFPTWRS